MNKTSLIAATALAMALAACSKEPAGEEASQTEAAGPAATGDAVMAPAHPVEQNAIPEVLRGRWGMVPADCTSTRGDAKGLLTIGADKLEFYESVASLGPIRETGADSISASFAFSGEGETWIEEVTLSTTDGGKTLMREDTGPDAQPGPFTYTKCP